MENEDKAAVVVGFLISILTVLCFATLTIDDTPIDLKAVDNMVSKCDNNGGLDYIEHDYDVKCKNGATFDYDRFEVSK